MLEVEIHGSIQIAVLEQAKLPLFARDGTSGMVCASVSKPIAIGKLPAMVMSNAKIAMRTGAFWKTTGP